MERERDGEQKRKKKPQYISNLFTFSITYHTPIFLPLFLFAAVALLFASHSHILIIKQTNTMCSSCSQQSCYQNSNIIFVCFSFSVYVWFTMPFFPTYIFFFLTHLIEYEQFVVCLQIQTAKIETVKIKKKNQSKHWVQI